MIDANVAVNVAYSCLSKYQVDMPKTLVTYVPCDVFKAPTMLYINLVGIYGRV